MSLWHFLMRGNNDYKTKPPHVNLDRIHVLCLGGETKAACNVMLLFFFLLATWTSHLEHAQRYTLTHRCAFESQLGLFTFTSPQLVTAGVC